MSVTPSHARGRTRPFRRGLVAASLMALLGASLATPALAAEAGPIEAAETSVPSGEATIVPAAEPVAAQAGEAAAAKCEGQEFSQPFTALGDLNYYTLAPGGQFESAGEGWQLSGGARIVETGRPDETQGGVLELPSGSEAVSPPMCVTLLYPTARVYVRRAEGGGSVRVWVSYPNLKKPRGVASLKTKLGQWALSAPFEVRPQLGGLSEETREVRFILSAKGDESEYQVYGLYVDPRML